MAASQDRESTDDEIATKPRMSARERPGASATPWQEFPTHRTPDSGNAAHSDGCIDTNKGSSENAGPTPPIHNGPTHGTARFLFVVDPETPVDELPAAYERWRRSGDPGQTSLSKWGVADR